MKNVGMKILKVMEEVKSVVKDGTNSFHKYKYASDAAIVTTIRKSLIKNKLICLPRQMSCTVNGEMTMLEVEYSVIDLDSGEIFYGRVYGQGQDKGDKGVYKAATGAEKYFLLKTFLLPTGDDPEKDEKPKYSKSSYDQRPDEEIEYNTGIRPFAGYTAMMKTDPKAAQERIGEGFYVKNTPSGVFIFTRNQEKLALDGLSLRNPQEPVISDEEVATLKNLIKDKGMKPSEFTAYLKSVYGIGLTAEIKKKDYSDLYQWVIVNAPEQVNG